MADILAVRHVDFEHLGTLEPLLAARGHTVRYVDAGTGPIDAAMADEPGLIAMLGGPIGAYEESLYPFLRDELALIERRLKNGGPLLGICLGAQLIARALGASVHPGPRKEIGWAEIAPTIAGKTSPLARLAPCDYRVLHWHGDIFDLPDGADCLASTAATPNQAFSIGASVLGLQFHVEIVPGEIERWLIGHACEIAGTKGVSVGNIRNDTVAYGSALADCSAQMFADWLDGSGL
tara:strand:- start:6 stop:713 length:708 start_codon:yes stop_codon:yes gene_type:complete